MPASHDVYCDQLSVLRRGFPLYYPDPPEGRSPIEIGDVGFTREGSFIRLFNASKPPNDPCNQLYGVPESFELLDLGDIHTYENALEYGPLHCNSVKTLAASLGTPGSVLPVEASIRFNCTSKQGAVLVLETQMKRETAVQKKRFTTYLRRHCRHWHEFANQHDFELAFGDLMLVTECNKTAAWSSSVYWNSAGSFGLSFSPGSSDIAGFSIMAGSERIGPMECRRSQKRPCDPHQKDQTVFIKACRLGWLGLYHQSVARLFLKSRDPSGGGGRKQGSSSNTNDQFRNVARPPESSIEADITSSSSSSAALLVLQHDVPDFNLTSALLALELEASGADCAIVHDDDWCMPTLEASQMIEQYTRFYFEELPLMLVAPADSSQLPDVDDSRNPGYTSPVIPQPEFNDTDESETDFEGSDWDRASGQETDETSIDGDDDFRDLFTTQEKPSLHPLLRGSQHGGPALVWDLRSDPVLASLRHAGAVPPLIPVTEDELLQPATTPPVSVLCVSCGIIPPSFTWGTITVHPNKKVVTVLDVLWNLRRTIRSPLTQREWGDLSKKQQQRVAAIFDSRWRETATPAETRAGGVLRQDCLLQHTVWAGLTLSPVEEDMAILTLRRPDSTL